MKAKDRDQLIDDLLEGDLSEADFLRLEAEMIVNEEARVAYYDRQKLQTGLELEAEEVHRAQAEERGGFVPSTRPGKVRFDWILVSGMAALVALVGVIGWKIGQDTQKAVVAVEPVASGFGVLARERLASWKDGQVLHEGDLLPPGVLELVSGTVKLEFFNGVDLVLTEGARIEVRSDYDFRFDSGKALFWIPTELNGVRVETPSGEVCDFGTEFALEVTSEFESVEVLEGSVEWKTGTQDPQRIEEGRGLLRRVSGETEAFASKAPSMMELERAFAKAGKDRREQWQKKLNGLRSDERVIALYSPEQASPADAKITDQSSNHFDGDVIRSARVLNRWGEPFGGIDFTPTGSRVRVKIEGSYSSLTLACWVKIDSLDRLYNSLFLTDGHEQFEPHWQIMNNGRIFFSVKAHETGKGGDKHIAFSPPVWDPTRSGQWMHLATVFDGAKQTTTHYVNGVAVSMDQIPENLQVDKVEIGAASIGNWSEPRYRNSPEFAVRNLNGTMDELILFSTPLTANEIYELYQDGKP
ncbi:MAG: FecR domain-containing protein [Verrucomicrobiales bacterium]|nr:FecR domain-containing protein [Verrucomicrobiales bacterium]